MQRLYDFLRRHPTWVDGFWAVILFGLSVVGGATTEESRGTELPALTVPVVLLLSLVVALRRRMPERMLMLALGWASPSWRSTWPRGPPTSPCW